MEELEKMSDEQVVELVRNEDKEIYEEIINRYQEKLMRYAVKLTGDEQIGADVVQDAFIDAYINLQGFDVKKKFSSWIYRIVHNKAMNVLNKNKKKVSLVDGMELDSGVDVEDEMIKKSLREKTYDCLGELPVKYREVLVLFFLEDKAYEEISDILRVPVSTVGTRIRRGKLLMKQVCRKIKK